MTLSLAVRWALAASLLWLAIKLMNKDPDPNTVKAFDALVNAMTADPRYRWMVQNNELQQRRRR